MIIRTITFRSPRTQNASKTGWKENREWNQKPESKRLKRLAEEMGMELKFVPSTVKSLQHIRRIHD